MDWSGLKRNNGFHEFQSTNKYFLGGHVIDIRFSINNLPYAKTFNFCGNKVDIDGDHVLA